MYQPIARYFDVLKFHNDIKKKKSFFVSPEKRNLDVSCYCIGAFNDSTLDDDRRVIRFQQIKHFSIRTLHRCSVEYF